MRTLKCEFCGKEISAKAEKCLSCDKSFREKKAVISRKELKKLKEIG